MSTHRRSWIVLLLALTAAAQPEKQRATPQPTVVFVCEHGAAKSVIAAAWFNKLAAERHLPFHAIARGTTPQEELAESAVTGLRGDRVPFPSDKPRQLTPRDASDAVRVVAFCPLPASVKPSRLDTFDVPAPKDGYDQSRDEIRRHVESLLDELQKSSQQR